MIADGKKVVADILRGHPAIVALDARVVNKTPSETVRPWIRVTLLNAPNVTGGRPEHLIAYLLQFDCYAGTEGGQPEANLLARTARAVLHDLPDGPPVAGVVFSSARFVGMVDLPDPDLEPARARVVLTAEIRLHT